MYQDKKEQVFRYAQNPKKAPKKGAFYLSNPRFRSFLNSCL